MARAERTLVVKALPPGKDRADLLDYIRTNYSQGFKRIVYDKDGRSLLVFDDPEHAGFVLENMRLSTLINADYAREEALYTPKPRPEVAPSPVVRVSPSSTNLSRAELEKLMRCYRGLVSFELLEDDPDELAIEGKLNKAPGSGRKRGDAAAYVIFRDMFLAEQALDDLTDKTNVVANFALKPERVKRSPEQTSHRLSVSSGSGAKSGNQLRGSERNNSSYRIDPDKATWIVVSQIPDDVSYSTLKRHFHRLDEFQVMSFQHFGILVAFASPEAAKDALTNLQENAALEVHLADAQERGVFKYPSTSRNYATIPGLTLYIRLPTHLAPRRMAEILRSYEGYEEGRPIKDHILCRFISTDAAERALDDLERYTDLYVDFSSKPLLGARGGEEDSTSVRSAGSSNFPSAAAAIRNRRESASSAQSPATVDRPGSAAGSPLPVGVLQSGQGPWAIFVPNIGAFVFNLQYYFSSLNGFERFAVFDEGCYVWFRSRDAATRAAAAVEAEHAPHLTAMVIEKNKPRERMLGAHAVNEHQTASLFIRNVPGLPREHLALIVESFPNFVTFRGLKDYIIVDYADVESARATLSVLRATSNIRVDYSNKSARSMEQQMLLQAQKEGRPGSRLDGEDDRWETGSNRSDGSQRSKGSGGEKAKTIYVTNLGSKDKADIISWVQNLPGFIRCQFGQANFRVVMDSADSAREAVNRIRFLSRSMKATYARKHPETKHIEELGEPSKVLWTSTLYWNEGEFTKFLKTQEGFERLVYDSAHSWVHFKDVESARKALMFLNGYTNLYSVFSSKKFDGGRGASAPVVDELQQQQQLQLIQQQQAQMYLQQSTHLAQNQHAWEASGGAKRTVYNANTPAFVPANTGSSPSGSRPVTPTVHQASQLPTVVAPTPMLAAPAMQRGSSSATTHSNRNSSLFDEESAVHVARLGASPGAEHFPVQRKGQQPVGTRIKSNVVMVRNSSVQNVDELKRILAEVKGFEDVHVEKGVMGWLVYVRFGELVTATEFYHSYEMREVLGMGYGGVSFQYRGRGEVPAAWENLVVVELETEVSPIEPVMSRVDAVAPPIDEDEEEEGEILDEDDNLPEVDADHDNDVEEEDDVGEQAGASVDPWALPPTTSRADAIGESSAGEDWGGATNWAASGGVNTGEDWGTYGEDRAGAAAAEPESADQEWPIKPSRSATEQVVEGVAVLPPSQSAVPVRVGEDGTHYYPLSNHTQLVEVDAPTPTYERSAYLPVEPPTIAAAPKPITPVGNPVAADDMASKLERLMKENSNLRSQLSKVNARIERVESEVDRVLGGRLSGAVGEVTAKGMLEAADQMASVEDPWGSGSEKDGGVEEKVGRIGTLVLWLAKEVLKLRESGTPKKPTAAVNGKVQNADVNGHAEGKVDAQKNVEKAVVDPLVPYVIPEKVEATISKQIDTRSTEVDATAEKSNGEGTRSYSQEAIRRRESTNSSSRLTASDKIDHDNGSKLSRRLTVATSDPSKRKAKKGSLAATSSGETVSEPPSPTDSISSAKSLRFLSGAVVAATIGMGLLYVGKQFLKG
ncbi:hypothetical protein BJ742DRAFT_778847 [Cladochytrium replicatum]|nr:hypothetical protein BJ742DRAFT_778847 [Cladochytrium replicatum]